MPHSYLLNPPTQTHPPPLSLPPSQVAERTLFLWNNDYIVTLVAQNRTTILPLIFAALERNARSHWNQFRVVMAVARTEAAGTR
ncbi:unnamed protein product [Closterium sp. NIES-53]